MPEKEKDPSALVYKDLLDMLPQDKLPISREQFSKITFERLMDWYDEITDLEANLSEKYPADKVYNTKMHHLLVGSTKSYDDWVKFDHDAPGGEIKQFLISKLESIKDEAEIAA